MLLLRHEAEEFIEELRTTIACRSTSTAADSGSACGSLSMFIASLWAYGANLILQRHSGRKSPLRFSSRRCLVPPLTSRQRMSVLLDASCGKGISPDAWAAPVRIDGCAIDAGYAGGISPGNIEAVLDGDGVPVRDSGAPHDRYWLDMQSGVRTNTAFDLEKVARVLTRLPAACRRRGKGSGTVVTGTIFDGTVTVGDRLVLSPRAHRSACAASRKTASRRATPTRANAAA